MACRNIYETLAKPAFEYNQYIEGKKYCRRCDVFLYYNGGMFCPCCEMQVGEVTTVTIDIDDNKVIYSYQTFMKEILQTISNLKDSVL